MTIAEKVIEKRLRGERLSLEDGILLYEADLTLLGTAAKQVRNRLHPDNRVTFVIDRNIYYTNVCVADCSFCAFYRRPGESESYTLHKEEIFRKIQALVDIGGTQLLIQGGLNPELRLEYYVDLVRSIKEAFPQVHIHSFSPPEIDIIAKLERMSYQEVLARLKEAGLNSLPGGGAEILVDRVRKILSPKKISADNWIKVCRAAHEVGLKTTASMVFGHVETIEERIIHLLKIRALQDEAGGIRAFITWSMSTKGTPGLEHLPLASGEDYLRTVAVSRLMLDNVPSVQSGWVTEGHKLAQVALEFGANDMGGTLMEELVIEPTGIQHKTRTEDLVRLIERAGYSAAQRNTNYEIVREFN
ncbi:MAG: dehypoxanthine futalosine cyclase [Candidatus Omnitrophica bacterium]|nr:dehypoxanthine futalosine cyclase [Candidatus Omnitrophota bacterium]